MLLGQRWEIALALLPSTFNRNTIMRGFKSLDKFLSVWEKPLQMKHRAYSI